VSALSGCKKTMKFTWIGWPGKEVSCVAERRVMEPGLISRSLRPTVNSSISGSWTSTTVTPCIWQMSWPRGTIMVSQLHRVARGTNYDLVPGPAHS
jgi:hypothetical protein